ncbi:MAG: penicillin-binding protein 2 [Desulfovibrio sp.]|nr:MAG: penicillin-binding protein 2 [Desulfovibrio sp.]
MSLLHDPEAQQPPRSGLLLLQVLIVALFFSLGLRFWYLQVHKVEEFTAKARGNQLRRVLIRADRGLIRDRHGLLLAENKPAYALTLVREDCEDLDATLSQVSQWTGRPLEEIAERFEQGRAKAKPFEAMVLVDDIPFDLLAVIESNSVFWPGLEIDVRPRREYPYRELLAHVLGYVSVADEEDMDNDPGLSSGDLVGKAGVELVFENRLRGTKGLRQLEVDVSGRILREEIVEEPQAGEHLTLAIDAELQAHAMAQLEGQAGAVVVMEPFSGQVLALVTQPSYDNNMFTTGLSQEQWASLRDDPRHPLQNRVIQSVYPPGSVWKVLMTACGLSSGLLQYSDRYHCPGSYRVGRRVFRCWRSGGHGTVDLMDGLVHSCDVYFYKLGEKLDVDRISEYAFASGFGAPTGIDLPHENGGLVPTREWKERVKGEPWQGGDTLNLSIGQGFTLVNPLQVARFLSALVNGGEILKPNILADAEREVLGELNLDNEDREFILQAMEDTVTRGTARRIYRPDARIGGKTGTAQVIRIGERRERMEDMPYEHRDHAWLASWGIKDDQAYVVVVMVEHGGHGSSGAGPVVKAMYDYLFPLD